MKNYKPLLANVVAQTIFGLGYFFIRMGIDVYKRQDTGCQWQTGCRLPEADFIVLVCGGKWWENDASLQAARSLKRQGTVILLFNHMSGGARLRLPEDLKELPCCFLPFFSNPFQRTKTAGALSLIHIFLSCPVPARQERITGPCFRT